MGVLEDLTRLTETAGDIPPHDGRELFRTVRRRRTRRRAAGGTVATLAAVLVAATVWPGDGPLAERLIIDEIAGSDSQALEALPVPERGTASAGYLEDGTPVFVGHDEDGTVRVLDALDAHLGKLVVYCPLVQRFLEPRAGSMYLLDGTWTGGGPSPADLSRYPAEIADDATRVVVTGELEPSGGRSADQSEFEGLRCEQAVVHEPDTSAREQLLGDAVPDDGTWGWAYLRREVLEDRSLVLCHALRGCADPRDRLSTGVQLASADDPADYPQTTPRWALVRAGPDGIEVREAARDIEINTGPRTGLDQVRFEIGWAPRHLVRATDPTGHVLDVDRLLRLRFDPDGWFSADLPCTTRYGRYELTTEGTTRFREVRTTPDDPACNDQQLQEVLETVLDDGERTLHIDRDSFELATPEEHHLVYSWSASDPPPTNQGP